MLFLQLTFGQVCFSVGSCYSLGWYLDLLPCYPSRAGVWLRSGVTHSRLLHPPVIQVFFLQVWLGCLLRLTHGERGTQQRALSLPLACCGSQSSGLACKPHFQVIRSLGFIFALEHFYIGFWWWLVCFFLIFLQSSKSHVLYSIIMLQILKLNHNHQLTSFLLQEVPTIPKLVCHSHECFCTFTSYEYFSKHDLGLFCF